ncbi:hypothetical protein CF98_15675 [Halopseudomonas bauzanensis]|nr:hypothetical protein CF98_15675 [Halopseudomonas bauzanensis]
MEERAVMLAAVQAVTDADAVWLPGCGETNVATEATAGEVGHVAFSKTGSVINLLIKRLFERQRQ